jgi:hypothetical protein
VSELKMNEACLSGESVRVRVCRAAHPLGKSVDPAGFVRADAGDDGAVTWTRSPLPEPDLTRLGSRARQWELSRYRAYQARLAGRAIARTFTRCTEFLAEAAGLVGGSSVPG